MKKPNKKQKTLAAQNLEREKSRISTENVKKFCQEAEQVFPKTEFLPGDSGREECMSFVQAVFGTGRLAFTFDLFNYTIFRAEEFNPTVRTSRRGAYVKVNALNVEEPSGPNGGVRDVDCCTENVMIELDKCQMSSQFDLWSLLISIGLPVVTLVDSRGKSLHAILRLAAGDPREFKRLAAQLVTLLAPFLPDGTSVNPSRCTRIPGFKRAEKEGKVQNLLYLNPDAPAWRPESACNDVIRSFCHGLEDLPAPVRESMARAERRFAFEETPESDKEKKEFNKWSSGLPLKGGLDMDHFVTAAGWSSCEKEETPQEVKFFVECPWREEHSGGGDADKAKDAYIFERKTNARFKWGFHCSHDACRSQSRSIKDVFEVIQSDFEAEFLDSVLPYPDVEELFDEEEAEPPQTLYPEVANEQPEDEMDKGNGTGAFLAMRCSEYADSELFRRLAGHKIRYLHDEGRWAIWKNGVWIRDKSEKIREMAKVVSKKRFERAGDNEDLQMDAAKSASTKMIDAVLKTVRSVKGIAATSDQFDRNPWLLGCQNGVLNLQTLEFGPGRPGDYVSLRCGAFYDPSAVCPGYDAAISGILRTNPEVEGFLDRWFGYSITGSDRDQFMVIFYGQGRNGKSTLLDAIRSVLGEYGVNSPKGLLIANPRGEDPDAATPSLMGLKGKRMACVSETEADSKLAESKVKAISGGEPVAGRRLHKDLEEFRVAAKVILSSNHIPRIAGTDTGIWRRILQVGFHENFEGREDTSLKEVLESEKSGILNRLIRGCLEWQERGLQIPASVLADTKGLRESMDVLGLFLSQCCTKKEGDRAFAKEVYGAYKTWALESGVRPWSAITFNRHMKSRGWAEVKLDGYPRWKDLSLSGGAEVEL